MELSNNLGKDLDIVIPQIINNYDLSNETSDSKRLKIILML